MSLTHNYENNVENVILKLPAIDRSSRVDNLRGSGFEISRIKNLQIVNGGQTTASIFHTYRQYSDKFAIDDIFIQMKLTVISHEDTQTVVPKISEFANTQNRINPADFFSNSPHQMRMEELSRRVLIPPSGDSLRETKWFYERARGQYNDAQSTMKGRKQP